MTSFARTGTSREHREWLATAVAAAIRATDEIRRRSADRASLAWRAKAAADFVSDVDVAAEEAIREVIAARHADAMVVGEELTPGLVATSGLAFIVDPLDGTTNFLHGYPWYAVSIGVVSGGELAAAVVLNVATGELFTATAGGGARRNGEPITVSAIDDPSRALIGTGFPFKQLDRLDEYQRQFAAVTRATSGIRRAGAAALDLADVACGRFEAFWELGLAPWDVAAGILLVREAGGIVTDLRGEPSSITHGSFVAGSRTMHEWLLRTLAEATGS